MMRIKINNFNFNFKYLPSFCLKEFTPRGKVGNFGTAGATG